MHLGLLFFGCKIECAGGWGWGDGQGVGEEL